MDLPPRGSRYAASSLDCRRRRFSLFVAAFQVDLTVYAYLHQDGGAVHELAREQAVGERVFHLLLDHAAQRARAEIGVVSQVGQSGQRFR